MENYFEKLLHNMWENLAIDVQKNKNEKGKIIKCKKSCQ